MIEFSNTSGSNNRQASFTDDQVREIRRICDNTLKGNMTGVYGRLAKRFKVHPFTIRNVALRKTYLSVMP